MNVQAPAPSLAGLPSAAAPKGARYVRTLLPWLRLRRGQREQQTARQLSGTRCLSRGHAAQRRQRRWGESAQGHTGDSARPVLSGTARALPEAPQVNRINAEGHHDLPLTRRAG